MYKKTYVWHLCYDGDDDKGGGSEKKFTQEEVNAMMASNKRKLQEDNKTLADSLKELQDKHKGDTELVAQLQEKIDSIDKKDKTEVTLAKEELERSKKAHAAELKKTQDERDGYQTLFAKHKIETEITQAAIAGEAFSPQQINVLLSGKAKLVPKDNGDFAVEIEHTEIKDGVSQKLILSPTDAVKRMKEDTAQWGNLFKSGVKGGVGGSNDSGGKENFKAIISDPAKYRENRAKILQEVGKQ